MTGPPTMTHPKMWLPLLLAVTLSPSAPNGRRFCVESLSPRNPHRPSFTRNERRQANDAPRVLRAAELGAEGDDGFAQYADPGKRTLYDVLRSAPDATRDELKRQYVALARESHPDAMIGRDAELLDGEGDDPNRPDFNEVARAWKLLSDPRERKRYDRSLKAERFTEEVESMAGRAARATVPQVQKIFDKVAVPLIRRTTATTVATIAAATQDLNSTKVDLGSAFESAVRAGRKTGRAIDRLELLEKSKELENRAREETEKAIELKDELEAVTDQRLKLVESVVMLRKTLASEIAALGEAERDYYEHFDENSTSQREFEICREAPEQAEVNAASAVEAEWRARDALVAAEQLVASSQQAMLDCAKSLSSVEASVKRSAAEVEQTGLAVEPRQERAREVLFRKEMALQAEWERIEAWKSGELLVQRADPANADARSVAEGYHFDSSAMALAASGSWADAAHEDAAADNFAQVEELREKERYPTAKSATGWLPHF